MYVALIQLINLLNSNYVVGDKSAKIFFKRHGNEDLYAEFNYSEIELNEIIGRVKEENEIQIVKRTQLNNKDKITVFCEVKK
ncbi:hypothetical protein AV926_18745 [Myroides marinus]|uniref:Uncharacterized protein n=1 Tax=Myroides marinus TaxID=703342 RepID=A0A161SDA0_9FLAO|nr:hypothetical protein [Myroides marinus]KZE84328.1 hypothetical protein AV926_18745 [Myroides marinus]